MQPRINSLQDVVRKIVRQVIDWGEPRFKRITMSHDASNNPAEIVGIDGTICYRKAGGSCVELVTSTGESVWDITTIDSNAAITPKLGRHIVEEDVWIEDNGASADSDITYWVVTGGGSGTHPIEEYA